MHFYYFLNTKSLFLSNFKAILIHTKGEFHNMESHFHITYLFISLFQMILHLYSYLSNNLYHFIYNFTSLKLIIHLYNRIGEHDYLIHKINITYYLHLEILIFLYKIFNSYRKLFILKNIFKNIC